MVERVPQMALDADTDTEDVPDEPRNRNGVGKSSSSFDVGDENQQLTLEQGMELSTYVVQIPKDQIYHVPSPENAKLVERLRNLSVKKGTPCCGRVLWIGLILVAVAAVIGGTILVLRQVYSPEAAVFSVVNVVVKSNKSSRPRYEIMMNAKNPNDNVEINYQSNGEVVLYFKTQKLIASGNFPELHQENSDSRNVSVVLAGSSSGLPEEVSKSMNDGKRDRPVSLELKLTLKEKMNLGALNLWSKEMEVVCNFKVSTLRAGTKAKILSQECQSKIK